MSAETTKIIIKAGGKKLKVSAEEAKALQAALNETLGEKEVTVIPMYPIAYPGIVERPALPAYPIWVYESPFATWSDSVGSDTYVLGDGSIATVITST